MPYLAMQDNTKIYYEDYGKGETVLSFTASAPHTLSSGTLSASSRTNTAAYPTTTEATQLPTVPEST